MAELVRQNSIQDRKRDSKATAEKAVPIVVWIGASLAAILFGILFALGIYPIVIALLAVTTGLVLISYPIIGLWVVVVGALVIAGLVDLYMPSLKPLIWGVALLSMALAGLAIIKNFRGDSKKTSNVQDVSALGVWSFLFVSCTIFASLVNWHGLSGFLVGLKGYFQIWGLLIAIFFFMKDGKQARYLMIFFVVLGFLQMPFILHQFLVLVPQRSSEVFAAQGIVAGDIVAGTFGGTMNGGGRSPILALLCVISITLVLAKLRAGSSTYGQAILAGLFFLIPMFLSEAKVFFALFPLALFLLFKDRILLNPLKVLVSLFLLAVLLMAIFFTYSLLPGAKSQKVSSLQEMFEQNVEYNLGHRGYGNAKLNRTTVYPFWAREHAHGDMLVHALIGHGPGSTSSGTALNRESLAYKRYRGYGIGLTGLSSLLWEVGVFGTFAVVGMLLAAYRLGGRLVERWQGTVHWATLKAAQIAIPLFSVSLLHNNYFVFDLSFQTMLIVILGYLMVMARMVNHHD